MSVIAFPKQASAFQPVAHYIRLGETSYRKVADLAAAGVIKSKRFVVDGSKIGFRAPWAPETRGVPLAPDVFRDRHPTDIYGAIARCAVKHGVSAVLSPSHYLADPSFGGWQAIDHDACMLLRRALDTEGGKSIAIDYLVAARLTDFMDESFQSKMMPGGTISANRL